MRFLNSLAVLALLASGPALAQGGPPGGQKTVVETVEASRTTIRATHRAVGTLLADASAELRAEVPGQILALHFEEGQQVGKGDRLISIEATVLEAEVNEARANAERSRSQFVRAKELHDKKLISATDYEAAAANSNVDTARLLSAQARLSKTVIRAPFAGFTGLRRINVGDYTTVGQSLIDLVRLDPMRVDFSVPETLLAELQVGQPIEVYVDAYGDEPFVGKVTAISPKIDVQGHSIQIRGSVSNTELKLRPGLFARVQIGLDSKENAVVIPEEAIWPIGQDKTVFVVVDGVARQKVVELGTRQAGVVEVVAGVGHGDVVVTAGQMKLHDGAPVETVAGRSAAGL